MIKNLIGTIVLFTFWFLMYLFNAFHTDINELNMLLVMLCLCILLSSFVVMINIILNTNDKFYQLEKSNIELNEKLDELIKGLKK